MPYARKVTVDQLKPGMFVEALDRPWLETDYLLQGVLLETGEDIQRLQTLCEHVYITEHSEPPPMQPTTLGQDIRPPRNRGKPARSETRNRERRTFQEELGQARVIRDGTKLLVDTMFDDIQEGRQVNTDGAQQVVTQMMDSVQRHPDALVWFTNLKNRDEYTAIHSMNVSMLSITLATFIGADEDTIQELGVGALLHDVGKIKVPLEILNKPGKHTDAEFAIMKKHPEYGVEILQGSPNLSRDSIEVVRSHHERLDGKGYPQGLKGDQISWYNQLVSLADVYDAMTSDRVYQKGRSPATAFSTMRDNAGAFNMDLLNQFMRCIGDYPIGSLVELNTGEVGFVTPSVEKQEKPTVLLVLDHNKKRYFPQRVRDLMRFPRFKIARVLPTGAFGLHVNEYAEQYQ